MDNCNCFSVPLWLCEKNKIDKKIQFTSRSALPLILVDERNTQDIVRVCRNGLGLGSDDSSINPIHSGCCPVLERLLR